MIGTLAALASLLAFGAHTIVPWRLAGAAPELRHRWALASLPLLATASLLGILWMGRHPDALMAAGWGQAPISIAITRAVMVLIPALALTDGLLLLGRGQLAAIGWRMAAVFALLPLAATTAAAEVLRVGPGPTTTSLPLIAAIACRAVVALGAGEAAAPWPPSRRPLWTLPAGLLLPVYPLALPAEVRLELLAGGDGLTLGAAAALFLLARWLPERLRRPAVLGAFLLAALFFARTAAMAEVLTRYLEPVRGLPAL